MAYPFNLTFNTNCDTLIEDIGEIMKTAVKADIKQIIIDKVITLIEKNKKLPWIKPWYMPEGMNLYEGTKYRGINSWITSMGPSPFFLTTRIIHDFGIKIIEGSLSYPITWYQPNYYLDKTRYDEMGYKKLSKSKQQQCKFIPWLKYNNVFNLMDLVPESLPNIIKKRQHKHTISNYNPKIDTAECLIEKNNPAIKKSGKAFYRPIDDFIGMPPRETFTNSESYYTTMFHEMAHWTGAKSRLNREGITNLDLFNTHQYSIEELVAEFSASQLAYNMGIETTMDNSTAYIAGWVSQLKNDPDMLFTASKKAEKVIEFLNK